MASCELGFLLSLAPLQNSFGVLKSRARELRGLCQHFVRIKFSDGNMHRLTAFNSAFLLLVLAIWRIKLGNMTLDLICIRRATAMLIEDTTMIRTALILSVVAISVSGCADVIVDDPYLVDTKFTYSKPHTSQKQADAQWAKCQKENMSDPDRGMNSPEKRLAEQCMRAKGYTITDSSSAGAKIAQPAN